MAKAPAKQEEPEAPKKGKKKLFIIIIALVLVLALGGGAVVLLKKPGHGEDGDEPAKASKHEVPPIFVRLESFTLKLQAYEDKPDQYLQVVPELKVINAAAGEKVKVYMPEIRHNMLLILSSKNSGELSSPQGVEKLSTELRSRTNQILGGEAAPKGAAQAADKAAPDDPVQDVLFTSFIIQ
jgi:flagellar protein FliL